MLKVALVALATLLIVPLSGCVSEDDAPTTDDALADVKECANADTCGQAVLGDDGRDLRTELVANDTLDAPEWSVGDVFEQHVYYGSEDTGGTHIKTMVVEDQGDCMMIATDNKEAAKFEATFDLPILGCIGKESLKTTAFDEDWSWMYDFPLEDGKSWDGAFEFMYNWNTNGFIAEEFTLTASYAEAIDTPFGDYPGFQIEGVTDDGENILSYNYVPAVGWFSHFWIWDISTPEDGDVVFHAMSMGNSKGYEGVYYIDESTQVIENFIAPFALFEGGEAAMAEFSVPEGATYLKGIVAPIACPGQSIARLTSPSGQQTEYTHEYKGEPADCTKITEMEEGDTPDTAWFSIYMYDETAEPGDWRAIAGGTGPFSGAYISLMAVTEVEYTLGPAADPLEA